MSSSSGQFDLTEPAGPPAAVRWRNWPLGENRGQAAFVVAALTATGMGVHCAVGRVHLVILAVVVLALAFWRFFVPTWYELNAEGVTLWTLGRRRQISWADVRHYQTSARGVLLLPRSDPTPIDTVRGLYLPWRDHREQVLGHVRYHLDPSPKPQP